jgi:hypothetical protein
MRNPTYFVVALTTVLLLPVLSPLEAADIYVDNLRGNDRFFGSTAESTETHTSGPVRTLRRALQLARSGDRIVLANHSEPYRESLSLVGSRHSGTEQFPFTILGNGATLDGSIPLPTEYWAHSHDDVFRFHPAEPGTLQLYLEGKPLEEVDSPVDIHNGEAIEPLQWFMSDGLLFFRVEPGRSIEDYELSISDIPTGVTLLHVRHVRIEGLTVQGFRVDGVHGVNSASEVVLDEVITRGNGRAGVVSGPASKMVLGYCTLGDNGRAQLLARPASETILYECQVFDENTPGIVEKGGTVKIMEDEDGTDSDQ